MLRRHTFWLKVAVGLMTLTAIVHSLSLVAPAAPRNETERQLMDLMATYRLDAGDGFHPTMANLMTALSACFTFVCLLGALTMAYLLRRRVALDVLKGVAGIHAVIFACVFVVMLLLTFSPPIVLTGLITLGLALGYLTVPSVPRM
jgi:hypothetical protein